jgi:S1-C subfamily serine protease
MKIKAFFGRFLTALFGGGIAIILFILFVDRNEKIVTVTEPRTIQLAGISQNATGSIDLTVAAESSVKSVVHITTIYTNEEYQSNPFYDFLFGNSKRGAQSQPSMGSGSGVIISDDGYIVTNNHVVRGSNVITVVLQDKRSYEAKLIGQDPYTDLALIKIDEEDLPSMAFGNSDNLKLGEWVLAVGNPFNLTSTVTAGIISAKARNLGIMNNRMSIESFFAD